MIQNERQYRITKAQAEKLEAALRAYPQAAADAGSAPRLQQAMLESMQSLRDELREEMDEYEALKSGRRRTFRLQSLDELPQTLIKARIASGLSQRELAQRLGLKEQQIQRYEATGYRTVTLERAREIAAALGVRCEALHLSLSR